MLSDQTMQCLLFSFNLAATNTKYLSSMKKKDGESSDILLCKSHDRKVNMRPSHFSNTWNQTIVTIFIIENKKLLIL